MCAAARAPKAADGRHFALPPPMSDRTGGANHGPMTAKFAGVRRFRLGVVNLPHTRRGPCTRLRAAEAPSSCETLCEMTWFADRCCAASAREPRGRQLIGD